MPSDEQRVAEGIVELGTSLLKCCYQYDKRFDHSTTAIMLASLSSAIVEIAATAELTDEALTKGITIRGTLEELLAELLKDYDRRMGLIS